LAREKDPPAVLADFQRVVIGSNVVAVHRFHHGFQRGELPIISGIGGTIIGADGAVSKGVNKSI
jgi:hypothetical protein